MLRWFEEMWAGNILLCWPSCSLSLSLSLAPEQPEAVTSLEILHSGNILIEWMLTCCCWGGLNQDEADRYCVVLVNAADLIGRLMLRLSKSLFKLSVSVYSQKSHWSHDVCPLGTMTIHPNSVKTFGSDPVRAVILPAVRLKGPFGSSSTLVNTG